MEHLPSAAPAAEPMRLCSLDVLDVLTFKAEQLQKVFFTHMPADADYGLAVLGLFTVSDMHTAHLANGSLLHTASDYSEASGPLGLPAHWIEQTPAQGPEDHAAIGTKLHSDLEYAGFYARKAHVCSIDAVHAGKSGRPDIAAQLRGMRDVYAHKARFLFNAVHYGALFVPCYGRNKWGVK